DRVLRLRRLWRGRSRNVELDRHRFSRNAGLLYGSSNSVLNCDSRASVWRRSRGGLRCERRSCAGGPVVFAASYWIAQGRMRLFDLCEKLVEFALKLGVAYGVVAV